jgi:hypothetical protein
VWATRISFLDVLSAVPPFLSHARKSKPAERRDRSQSKIALEEPDENTNKSTKFCFNKRTKLKYEQKHQILVESMADWALAREYDVDIDKYPILSC